MDQLAHVLSFEFVRHALLAGLLASVLCGIVGTFVFLGNWTAGINMLFIQSTDVSSSYTLMVIPLFIVLGSLASASGITSDLFTLFYRWFGRVRGGVAIATIGTCAGMASITGSSVATSATGESSPVTAAAAPPAPAIRVYRRTASRANPTADAAG